MNMGVSGNLLIKETFLIPKNSIPSELSVYKSRKLQLSQPLFIVQVSQLWYQAWPVSAFSTPSLSFLLYGDQHAVAYSVSGLTSAFQRSRKLSSSKYSYIIIIKPRTILFALLTSLICFSKFSFFLYINPYVLQFYLLYGTYNCHLMPPLLSRLCIYVRETFTPCLQ